MFLLEKGEDSMNLDSVIHGITSQALDGEFFLCTNICSYQYLKENNQSDCSSHSIRLSNIYHSRSKPYYTCTTCRELSCDINFGTASYRICRGDQLSNCKVRGKEEFLLTIQHEISHEVARIFSPAHIFIEATSSYA